MNKFLSIILLTTFVCNAVICQVETLIKTFEDSLKNVETFSYTATFLRKKPGHEKFIEKIFQVYAKRNKDNKGYNFDWELVEHDSIYEFRNIFIAEDFYFVSKPNNRIWHKPQTKKLEKGEYTETIRHYSIFNEILYGIESMYNGLPMKLTVSEIKPKLYKVLKIDLSENEEKYVTINKNKMFIEKIEKVVAHKDLNLKSIYKTILSNIQINKPLPDSILNPQHYIDQGYQIEIRDKEEEEEEEEEEVTKPDHGISKQNIQSFIQTPLLDANNHSIAISQFDSDILVIDFWYLSCMPCLKSIPYMQALEDKYKERGLKVVGVNFHDTAVKEKASQKLREKGILYTKLYSNRELMKKLKIRAFPTFLILDKNHNLLYVGNGIDNKTIKEMEIKIEGYLDSSK